MWLAKTARHLEKGFPEVFAAKPQAEETISGLCFLFIKQALTATRRKRRKAVHPPRAFILPTKGSTEVIRLVKDP